MLKLYGSAIVVSAALMLAPAAWAQSNPSADDLIKSLTPTGELLQSSGTRGLHRLMSSSDDAAPAPPTGTGALVRHAAVQPQAAMPEAQGPSASLYVQFATGSADLTPRAMATLNELGKALSSSVLSTYHFRIEGHTDTVGSKAYNLTLSQKRAAAVVAYIKQKFAVDESRMVPVGYGSDHLLVQTGDQTPEARNRRVQVVNLGA